MPTLQAGDGVDLHLRTWEADGAPRGTLVLVHGLGEHIGRYEHVADSLSADGWRVAGHDHRGHGQSGGQRGGLASADDLLADLATVIDHVRADGRLVLFGHSMGGDHRPIRRRRARAAAGAVAPDGRRPGDDLPGAGPRHEPGADGAAFRSRAGGADAGRRQRHQARLDQPRPGSGEAYKDDPLVHNRVTARLVRFLLDSGRLVRERAPSWKVPTLLLWAGADRCVAPAGSAAFAAAAPKHVVRSKEYPDCFHEILNEPEQAEVLDEIHRWLSEPPS